MDSRISRDEHGAYRWTGVIDRAYEDKAIKIALGVCGGICIFFVIMSLLLGGDYLGVTFLSGIVVMLVVGGVYLLFRHNAGNRKQSYIMNEESIQFHQRRYNAPFTFRSIKKAVIHESRDMIELFQTVGSGPVFTSHEDFPFIKDFILQHLPETAEIMYE